VHSVFCERTAAPLLSPYYSLLSADKNRVVSN
jgi:hypothetical protein